MSFLVTGAQGYVGSVVAEQLADIGLGVNIVDAGWFRDAYVLEQKQTNANASDFRALQVSDLKGIDTVIHLAGYSNDPLGWLNEQDTYSLNEKATVAFAGIAKQAGVRTFVFSSTCSVYGASGAKNLDETGPTHPLTPYAGAKLAAEKALVALQDSQFRVAILRGATAFGASPVPRTDLLLNELCAKAACGQPIALQSDGTSWRPFMPVDDFARALVVAATDDPQCDRDVPIWNIAPPTMQMTVKDAAVRAASIGGAAPPIVASNSMPDRRSYRVDGTRFLRAFPKYCYSEDFDRQVAKTVEKFRNIPTLAADLESDRFVRLASFKPAGIRKIA
ncbi:SDR family oxidoreductase [Loktanella sp. 5RATIMAR09]|uniref:NAD-dependent epimerase/dehydratase family protein n=1 Tax=Loktanella sp. 5RATIMAR09 TaxID=1225655 RepID=UPI0009F9E45E|nr:SDR family oxidoreductase [Loktanella sp. 5RATIMAR09]